jgi:hypothetical protein
MVPVRRFLKLFAGVPVEIRQVGIDAKFVGLSAAGKQAAAAGRPLVALLTSVLSTLAVSMSVARRGKRLFTSCAFHDS